MSTQIPQEAMRQHVVEANEEVGRAVPFATDQSTPTEGTTAGSLEVLREKEQTAEPSDDKGV